MSRRHVAVWLVALTATMVPGSVIGAPPARGAEPAIEPGDGWEDIVAAAAEAARRGGYEGEVVWATWDTGVPAATFVEVAHREGTVDVRVVRHGHGGGAAAAGVGSEAPEPGSLVGVVRAPEPARLAEKYQVSAPESAQVLDRACALVEIRHRSSDELRERLWVDVDSAVLLRRESYEGERLLRLAAFLSLDEMTVGRRHDSGRARRPIPGLRSEPDGAVEVNDRGIKALRAAGWTIRDTLPGGYRLEAVYAHGGPGLPPLQTVYGDGLYAVSLFEQRGAPDWDSLPPGARPAEDFESEAYEWPRASPRRVVWSGGETTFTLVGDPPPGEFRRIVGALPQDERQSWLDRLRSTVGGWWHRGATG